MPVDYGSDPSCLQARTPEVGLLGILVANDGEYVIKFVSGFDSCTRPWPEEDVYIVKVGYTCPKVGRNLIIYIGTECHEVHVVKKCTASGTHSVLKDTPAPINIHFEAEDHYSFNNHTPHTPGPRDDSDTPSSEFFDSISDSVVDPGAHVGTPGDLQPSRHEHMRLLSVPPRLNISPTQGRQGLLPMRPETNRREAQRLAGEKRDYSRSQTGGYIAMNFPTNDFVRADQLHNSSNLFELDQQYESCQWNNVMKPVLHAHGPADKPLPPTPAANAQAIPVPRQKKIDRLLNKIRFRTPL